MFFIVEMALKIFGMRELFFEDGWNQIDFAIVVVSVIERIIIWSGSNEDNSLSVVRLLRIMRVLRLITASARLGMLVRALILALKSVMWVGVLFMLLNYVFSVLAVTFYSDISGVPGSYMYFGTVLRSMLTLTQLAAIDDWTIIAWEYTNEGNTPEIWIFIGVWVMVASIGLLNLLTAIFIDALTSSTNEGKREMREQMLANRQELILTIIDLFHEYDTDNSGTLGMQELQDLFIMFEVPDIANRFDDAGIDMKEVKEAILYSDADGSGEVDYEEFLIGVTKMDEESVRCDTLELQSRVRMLLHTENVNHKAIVDTIRETPGGIRKVATDTHGRIARKAEAFREHLAVARGR